MLEKLHPLHKLTLVLYRSDFAQLDVMSRLEFLRFNVPTHETFRVAFSHCRARLLSIRAPRKAETQMEHR